MRPSIFASTAVRTCTLLLALSIAVPLNATAATTAIKFGKLWDGHGTITNAVVIVEDDKIQSVSANGPIPAGAEIIDLSRYTGMPGMINSHTHMSFYWDPKSGTDPRHQPPRHVAVTVFLSQANARRTLEAGVTTVRDLTGFDGADIAMRDLINMGAMVGPRMFVSGPGLRNTVIRRPGVTDTPAQAAKEAKAVLDAGADWVKVYGSTGGGDDVTGDETVSFEEMKAIIDTAHAAGHKVAIHSYGPEAHATRFAREPTRSSTQPTSTTRRSLNSCVKGSGMCRPSITTSITSTARTMPTNSLPRRNRISAITSNAIS